MKTVVINLSWIVGAVLLLALLLHTKITWKPFSISFENWRYVLGIFLIFAGVEIISHAAVMKYQKKLLNDLKELHETAGNTGQEEQRDGEENRQD